MSDTQSRPALPDSSFLANLKADDRDILSSYGEFISSRPEVPLIVEGMDQPNLYLVIAGSLAVYKDGTEINTINPGESIGEMSIFAPSPASATIVSKEFTQLWRINQEEFKSFIADNPVAANQILTSFVVVLSERLRVR